MSDYYRDQAARLLDWDVLDIQSHPTLTLGMTRSAAAAIERLLVEVERLNRENFWLSNKQYEKQARLIELPPLKKGDQAWCVTRRGQTWYAKPGPIAAMDIEDGKVYIHVSWAGRGPWGERVFATQEEAMAALERLQKEAADG